MPGMSKWDLPGGGAAVPESFSPGHGLEVATHADRDSVAAARILRRFGVYALVLGAIVALGGSTILGFTVSVAGGALWWAQPRG